MTPFERRRKQFLETLQRTVAIFPTAPITIRNKDIENTYRPDSDFFYLTNLDEPEAVLILSTAHPEHRSVLFLRPRDPAREQWEGRRLGVDEAPATLGVDVAYPISEFAERLPDYLQGATSIITRLGANPSFDQQVFEAIEQVRVRWKQKVTPPTRFIDPEENLHEMRLIKDSDEIATLRKAANVSAEGHLVAMKMAGPGMFEYQVEAALSHYFRSHGSQRHAYDPIVASGANATVLHYVANKAKIGDNDLILIDAGCELDGYASDITRTFPASGTFTSEQKAVYEIVLQAQLEAIDRAKPGATLDELHNHVCEVLVTGLMDLGLLKDSRERILEDKSYRRFYPHRTSHWMGADVHDVGRYYQDGVARKLEPGMVFTIEPGLYIPPTGDQAPSKFQGIGVRIEDDILITESGCEVLTSGVPKTVDEVEQACRG